MTRNTRLGEPVTPRSRHVVFAAWRDLAHPNAGGSEVLVDRLATELVRSGHRVTLLCGAPVAARDYDVLANGGTYTQYLTAPIRYWRHLRDADAVIDVANGVPFFAPMWRRGTTVALVTHVHGDEWRLYFPRPVARIGMAAERFGLVRCYARRPVVTISPSSADALEHIGVDRGRIDVLELGTDQSEASGSAGAVQKSSSPSFIAVGRLSPTKRIDLLLDAWETVRAQTGGELIIVGAGEPIEERRLRDRAGDAVRFTGFVTEDEKRALLGQAWLLLHPSIQEGWGLVIDEAAAANTPAIGFDVPGVRDAIDEGVTGRVVVTQQSFVSTWIELAGDEAARTRLGAAARKKAGARTWEQTAAQLIEVIDRAQTEGP